VPDPVEIVTAIVRRGDELLMVRQAGPGEQPVWSVPGGRVEAGELLTEALGRELLEESGVRLLDAGRVAFTVQVDDRRDGWAGCVWTWDVAAWEGEPAPDDPDGFVLDAAFVPIGEAIARLAEIAWHPLTVRYLRGELPQGSVWLRRVHEDGREEVGGPY
jgi:8-oxo-dGTP diphosphatase